MKLTILQCMESIQDTGRTIFILVFLLVVFHCKYNLYTGKIIFTDSVVKYNDQHLQVVYMYGKCGIYIYILYSCNKLEYVVSQCIYILTKAELSNLAKFAPASLSTSSCPHHLPVWSPYCISRVVSITCCHSPADFTNPDLAPKAFPLAS